MKQLHGVPVIGAPRRDKVTVCVWGFCVWGFCIVKSQYSRHYHTKYRVSGPVWRERFRAMPIEDEYYLRACGEYAENNPVKAGLVNDAKNWEFSSFKHYDDHTSDPLIDCYEQERKSFRSVEPEFDAKEFFEHGKVIGSAFFRWQFYEKMKRG